jgi:mono/diheme cytochrome c family protein
LSDEQAAALLTFVRNSWGNAAGTVEPADIDRMRY